MTSLDQFKSTYITECTELLADMEERLMGLNAEEADLEEVNAIFRCAHSIKGGGGAFGFTRLVEFTHKMEFLLDAMREGAVLPSEEIVDALLQSADVVAQFVEAERSGVPAPEGIEDSLSAKLEGYVTGLSSQASHPGPLPRGEGNKRDAVSNAERSEHIKPSAIDHQPSTATYRISFLPKPEMFTSGNEPLFIVRELQTLGELEVTAHADKLPPLEQLDPETCYLSWDFVLRTKEPPARVREVFEFVEDACELKIEMDSEAGIRGAGIKEEDREQKAESVSQEDDESHGGVFDDALEVIQNAPNTTSNVAAFKPVSRTPPQTETKAAPSGVTSIRVDLDKIDRLVNMVGELVIVQAMIAQQTKDLSAEKFQGLISGVEELSLQMRELQEAVMAVRMQPVKSVFARMPRIVRDLSRQLGKDIRLEMSGENTEIDKTVIEQLGDPLTHMIRNSVDHGIEMPEERRKNGKPEQGTIRLSADHSGGRIVIEISDDGKGINREKVRKKAIEKGLIAADSQLSEEEIDRLVFLPGFSTAEAVTDVSGRGVGMDVVRRNISDLGGAIEIENHPGRGSRFSVSLPLTLAILDGMIIRVGAEMYIVPINGILETLSVRPEEINRVAEEGSVINVRGEFLPILYLRELFGIPQQEASSRRTLVVLVESGKERFGLVVDELLGQQQVVIKSIEENSQPVPGVSGATILGDGNVSLILDVAKLRGMTGGHKLRKAA